MMRSIVFSLKLSALLCLMIIAIGIPITTAVMLFDLDGAVYIVWLVNVRLQIAMVIFIVVTGIIFRLLDR